MSDIVPLKERGKYQGFISAACSIGNAAGPFVGGGFASTGQWRWLFRVIAISGAVVVVFIHFIIPLKPVEGSMLAKIKMIDYTGIVLSSSGTIFLLIPISGGGSTFPWSSATTIALLVSGIVCLSAFLFVEAKVARLPVLPRALALRYRSSNTCISANMATEIVRLFRMRTPTVIMTISFLIGMIYYGVRLWARK